MAISTSAELAEALRCTQLLEPAQLDEISLRLIPSGTGLPQLAQELVQRGWLTTYQIDLLAFGRGAELVLGPYVILDLLGKGGMGKVYKARQRVLKRLAALKVIRGDLLQ